MVSSLGSVMEGDPSAAPRLARDFYAQGGWQPLPCNTHGGPTPAANQDLQQLLDPESNASDPHLIGQAKTQDSAANQDLHFLVDGASASKQAFPTTKASDPQQEGQATAIINHGASDHEDARWQASPEGGVPLNAASDPIGRQAAPFQTNAASTPIPTPLAAHPKASSSDPLFSLLAIPTHSPQCIPSVSTCSSKLRAWASPWQPNKSSLPFLFIGDIPVLSMSLTPKQSHPLLLPGARQSLASSLPAETLGLKQPHCCFYCGNRMHSIRSGSSSTSTLGFSSLRGENVNIQSQESYAAAHPQVMQARRANRPRFKMKKDLELLQLQKENLDPG